MFEYIGTQFFDETAEHCFRNVCESGETNVPDENQSSSDVSIPDEEAEDKMNQELGDSVISLQTSSGLVGGEIPIA